jgi:hypothetical protein
MTQPAAAAARALVVLIWTAGSMGSAQSQAPASSPAPAPAPCTAPEYRQFDFWIGNWDVRDPSGQVVGTNRITREYDGCVLQEHWEARGPVKQTGSSFNTYSVPGKHWHQTWVDSTGGLLLLDGGLQDGSMLLTAEMPARVGTGMVRHRIRFTPRPDGTVRQFWEVSRDGGSTWTANLDRIYVRRPD